MFLGGRFTAEFTPKSLDSWQPVNQHLYRRPNQFHRIRKGVSPDWDRTCHAYLITRSCCDFLVANSFDLLTLPIDYWIAAIPAEHDKVCLDYFPHLAHVPLDYKTDVQNSQKFTVEEILQQCNIGAPDRLIFKTKRKIRNLIS